jgi:hypothetical protein
MRPTIAALALAAAFVGAPQTASAVVRQALPEERRDELLLRLAAALHGDGVGDRRLLLSESGLPWRGSFVAALPPPAHVTTSKKLTMKPILAALAFAAALIGAAQTASAQAPYSYPYCAKYYTRGTPTSCYYASREQCMATVSGIGGYCYQNPGYRGGPVSPRHYRYRRY